jgi:hypothetical protein
MDKRDLVARLSAREFGEKLARNYKNIISRVRPDGYFQESLTGAYEGMYPRTLGGLARLLCVTGEIARIEPALSYCLSTMSAYRTSTVPHVIGEPDPATGRARFIDEVDQIDGQAHVILAWALHALDRSDSEFVERTYEEVAGLLDRSTSGPWLCFSTRWRIEPGLVLNTHFEHSREDQYWHSYDFLTQSFVASARERMIRVAERRKDGYHATLWTDRLRKLESNIARNLTGELHGRKVYLEMLLPTGRAPSRFEGVGWVNLASVASGWNGVDREILGRTIGLWHELAACEVEGSRFTSCDWPSPGRMETYGKILAWDLVYCLSAEWWNEACGILDFLAVMDRTELYTERFRYDIGKKSWETQDAGNGEQCVWMCWGFFEARRMLGIQEGK